VQTGAAGLALPAEETAGEEAQRLAVALAELQTSLDELQVAEEERERAREAGFDAHVTKPVDPGELQRLMEGAGRG
jgi:CheY-like chemotaxis protein